MPTVLYLDTANTFDSGSQYLLLQNPIQPRGMVKSRPVTEFATLEGSGGVQAPKTYFPKITLTWPALVKSNTAHAALLAAFEARKYIATGVSHYIGILDGASKDNGFPFWNAAKFIEIRILNVMSAEQPIDNDLDEILFDMIVTAKWMDPD